MRAYLKRLAERPPVSRECAPLRESACGPMRNLPQALSYAARPSNRLRAGPKSLGDIFLPPAADISRPGRHFSVCARSRSGVAVRPRRGRTTVWHSAKQPLSTRPGVAQAEFRATGVASERVRSEPEQVGHGAFNGIYRCQRNAIRVRCQIAIGIEHGGRAEDIFAAFGADQAVNGSEIG